MTEAAQRPPEQGADQAPPGVPQTTPPSIGFGHPEYHFVQGLMEIQKSLGEMQANIQGLQRSVSETKAKVDELINWRNRILGGAVVLGAVCALLGFLVARGADYVAIRMPAAPAIESPASSGPTGLTAPR